MMNLSTLRNLTANCVSTKMGTQGTQVPFRFHFPTALLTVKFLGE